METINTILGFAGYLIMLPIWILAVILIILGIIGLFKKNFVKFKKTLKIRFLQFITRILLREIKLLNVSIKIGFKNICYFLVLMTVKVVNF